MSDGGYEHDLREAENAMAAAGHPDIALGMRRHSEAQRNMMQGILVPMFVQMVERALDTKLAPLVASQKETQDGVAALGIQFQSLAEDVTRLDKRDAKQYAETQRLFRESQARQEQLARELAGLRESFDAYKAGSRRDDVDQLLAFKADVEARIKRALPEDETQQLIALLRQIAAERGGDG